MQVENSPPSKSKVYMTVLRDKLIPHRGEATTRHSPDILDGGILAAAVEQHFFLIIAVDGVLIAH